MPDTDSGTVLYGPLEYSRVRSRRDDNRGDREINTHGELRYNVLSVAFVSKATEPGHYHDGHGLILRVTRAGTKQWVQRLHIRGKRRELVNA